MKKLIVAAAILLLPSVSYAQSGGATATFTLSIKSPVSTSITLNPSSACTGSGNSLTCTLPLPANTDLASIVVAPTGWNGTVAVSGTSAVVVAGTGPNYTLSVGATAITAAQTISGSLTATP